MEVISLDLGLDYDKLGFDKSSKVSFTGYIQKPYNPEEKRPAVIVCPGGAYRICAPHEGDPVALQFVAEGIGAFILNYSVAPAVFPQAFIELSQAISIVRKNAQEWGIDSNKICILGFSAGGHLVGSVGTLWNSKYAKQYGFHGENKPNGMLLCYPVISSDPSFGHMGSFDNLLGKNKSEEMLRELSLEKAVSQDTAPTFIYSTFEDAAVPVKNTLVFVSSLNEHKIPFELHVYPKGQHGLSLASRITASKEEDCIPGLATWIKHAIDWVCNL